MIIHLFNKEFFGSAKMLLLSVVCLIITSCSRQTIYIVRHAEKDTIQKNNPSLTLLGLERAQDLSKLLKDKPISNIYSTNFLRTISTAQPTANEHQLTITLYDSIPQLNALLSFQKNKSVLIVGHSNTIIPIAVSMGTHPVKKEIEDQDYDNLFIIRFHHFLFWENTKLEETTYGMSNVP